MPLKLYNSLTRQKEVFEPLNAPYVGMYVCAVVEDDEVATDAAAVLGTVVVTSKEGYSAINEPMNGVLKS